MIYEMDDFDEVEKDISEYVDYLMTLVEYEEVKRNGHDYSNLLAALDSIDFNPDFSRDINRYEDGMALRREEGVYMCLLDTPCSMFEVLIAFARRIDIHIWEKSLATWFWEMLDNCGLTEFDNDHWDWDEVNHIVSNINNRKYGKDGSGGFFPLKHPREDQTKVELWYQMQAYVIENDVD